VDNEIEFRDRLVNVGRKTCKFDKMFYTELTGQSPDFLLVFFFPKESGSDNDKARVWKLLVHLCRGLQKDVLPFPRRNPANEADAEPIGISRAPWWRCNEVRSIVDHSGSPDKFGAGRIGLLGGRCREPQSAKRGSRIRNYVGWNYATQESESPHNGSRKVVILNSVANVPHNRAQR
jgi:hypothetical protein